jgi:hypothetical protein
VLPARQPAVHEHAAQRHQERLHPLLRHQQPVNQPDRDAGQQDEQQGEDRRHALLHQHPEPDGRQPDHRPEGQVDAAGEDEQPGADAHDAVLAVLVQLAQHVRPAEGVLVAHPEGRNQPGEQQHHPGQPLQVPLGHLERVRQ